MGDVFVSILVKAVIILAVIAVLYTIQVSIVLSIECSC